MNDVIPNQNLVTLRRLTNSPDKSDHPAWAAFIRYCTELDHGEIEILKIQHGLPVLAEITRKKVKFAP
jgi:hypothetical protein